MATAPSLLVNTRRLAGSGLPGPTIALPVCALLAIGVALHRCCRFRAVALPLSVAQAQVGSADSSVLRQLGSREDLTLAVHAAFLAGLKQVRLPDVGSV